MDSAVIAAFLGFATGIASTLVTQFVQYHMGLLTKASDRKWEAICAAYRPIVEALDQMIDAHPNHTSQRDKLRELYHQQGAKLSATAREQVRAALIDDATLSDLARARDRLEQLTEAKERG